MAFWKKFSRRNNTDADYSGESDPLATPATDDGSPFPGPALKSRRSRRVLSLKRILMLASATLLLFVTVGVAMTDHPAKAKAMEMVSQFAEQLGVAGGTTATPTSTVNATGVILDPTYYLNGVAGDRFRDVLRPDFQYLTTFHYAGLSNDLIQFCNLIYLGIISRRIPIIPPFEPSSNHIGKGAYIRNFGEIFDVSRLAASLSYPILEWVDVKRGRYDQPREINLPPLDGVEVEEIGCWSLSQTLGSNHQPMGSTLAQHMLYLNITWSPVPEYVRMTKNPKDYFGSTPALAKVILPESRNDLLHSLDLSNTSIVPDHQLACFDVLYYTGVREAWEWQREITVVWDLVGTNVHFAPAMETLADGYVRRLLGLEEDEEVPPFISMHVRRADFLRTCPKDKPIEDCVAPLSAYERRVNQVQEELVQLFGSDSPQATASQNVIVSSDEVDPVWWASVREKGWLYIDHDKEQTEEKLGAWYATIIDSVIQSRGAGFVGTQGSTYSLLSAKRVHDWNGGPSKMVFFGRPGEDEKHQRRWFA